MLECFECATSPHQRHASGAATQQSHLTCLNCIHHTAAWRRSSPCHLACSLIVDPLPPPHTPQRRLRLQARQQRRWWGSEEVVGQKKVRKKKVWKEEKEEVIRATTLYRANQVDSLILGTDINAAPVSPRRRDDATEHPRIFHAFHILLGAMDTQTTCRCHAVNPGYITTPPHGHTYQW
jgi:hypothetical protein